MIKKILLKLATKNRLFAKMKQSYQWMRDNYYKILPIDQKLIVFESFRSTKFADSPRALYEYMITHKKYSDYKFIWVFEHPEQYSFLKQKPRTRVVKHESKDYYTAFARAKYWVVNGWIPLKIQKKPEQVALQCWHGTPLKRLRYDIIGSSQTEHYKNSLRENDEDFKRYNYLISPSRFASTVFSSAFNLKSIHQENIILETGYPRNDFLKNVTPTQINAIKKRFSIPANKKVLLYAPTWRDDQNIEGVGYTQKLPVDYAFLQQKLCDDYIILFRAHNLVANRFNFTLYGDFIRDVSDVDDINDLYVISDVLMTDYSSVFFDYANLKRPIIFFMYDKEHYEKDLRGFYIDLNELPGDIVKEESEVVGILGDLKGYREKNVQKYKKFTRKYTYLEDGKATERVINSIFTK